MSVKGHDPVLNRRRETEMKPPFILALVSLALASPAHADIKEPIKAMIDEAMKGGNEGEVATIVKIAKRTNPDAAKEIADYHANWLSDRREAKQVKLAEADMLDNWHGKGEVGAHLTTGNNDSSGVVLGLKLNREGLKWRHEIFASTDIQRTNGKRTRERYLAGAKVEYKFSERGYSYGLGQYERDPFLGYEDRWSASGGIGYRLIDKPDLTLGLDTGPAFRHTDFTNGEDETKLAGRAAIDVKWKINPSLRLSNNASTYYETGGWSSASLTALDAKISSALTARLSYAMQHETDPLPGRDKLDTTSRATLVYGF